MKDIIRMNQLAGIITEGQAKKIMSTLNEEKPTNDMVEDYWSIMVKNQPEDVIKILVGLTNGELSFARFSLNTLNDVYDSFRDESYDDAYKRNADDED